MNWAHAEGTSDINTYSTSFVLMPDMSITTTTSGGDVDVIFSTSISHERNDRYSDYALFVDGVEAFRVRIEPPGNQVYNVHLSYLVTGLSAGSHTFEIRWLSAIGDEVRQLATSWGAGRSLRLIELN